MKTKLVKAFALVVGLLVACGSMLAHHGNSAYDTDHPITITRAVTEFGWTNPHCQVELNVKAEKNNTKLRLPFSRPKTARLSGSPERILERSFFPTAGC